MANVWKNLGTSNVGHELVDELKKMQSDICDSRNWNEDQTKESANHAAEALENVIDKIQKNDPRSKNKGKGDMDIYE